MFPRSGESPDTIFLLEYSSSIRKGLGNLSPAHVQEEKEDAYAEDKETCGVDSERFSVSVGGFVLSPRAQLPLHGAMSINPRELRRPA